MTHAIRRRHPLNAVGANPLIVTMRYQCECAANEVLAISLAIDMDSPDEKFIWAIKQMLRDVRFEVQQHLTERRPTVNEARDPANAPGRGMAVTPLSLL